jgi:hypothetical protein
LSNLHLVQLLFREAGGTASTLLNIHSKYTVLAQLLLRIQMRPESVNFCDRRVILTV